VKHEKFYDCVKTYRFGQTNFYYRRIKFTINYRKIIGRINEKPAYRCGILSLGAVARFPIAFKKLIDDNRCHA